MVADLFLHGRVITTLPKAKEYRRLAEKLITMGKKKSLHSYRRAISILQDKKAAKKLFEEIAPQYQERPGGYTRVLRLSKNRLGDNASRAVFELVDYQQTPVAGEVEEAPKKRGLFGRRKAAPAKDDGGAKAGKAPNKKVAKKKEKGDA
jgi:large subunit ribosomal protein L17